MVGVLVLGGCVTTQDTTIQYTIQFTQDIIQYTTHLWLGV